MAPIALLATIAVPATALAADYIGASGLISSIENNDPSADLYVQFHGRVIIGDGFRTTEYRWGGTSCGSKNLDEGRIDLLNHALFHGVQVTPKYKSGAGSTKCLVGFTFAG